ncbi:hypothetical protein [Haloplanus halophilus]|uniref:hypothetical protein n=1 Tax=Haloplanus halophilus TaxID=2949993 RepID=UPI00203E701A|nr:hypothetical protein [Haloplanus sp. GDY1]
MATTEQQQQGNHSNIRRAYRECLDARRLWLSVRNRTAEDVPKEAAHSNLHESVLAWFEALVPYISERPGEVKQLWESAPLWPEDRATKRVWACASGHVHDREEHDLSGGGPCPGCGMPVEPTTQGVTDDEGRPLYDWACGLKRLSAWQNRTKTQTVEADGWSAEQQTVEVPQRLGPTILMRAARYLDLAAEQCGLLEETDRALPTGEL